MLRMVGIMLAEALWLGTAPTYENEKKQHQKLSLSHWLPGNTLLYGLSHTAVAELGLPSI